MLSGRLVPTISMIQPDLPSIPASTDGGGGRLGYVAWDYHARSPADFGTIFKVRI